MKNIATLTVVTVILAACVIRSAPPLYDGPGTFQDFANARYQCVQETTATTTAAYINQYGGQLYTTAAPTCSAFTACMASKGYYESPTGQFDPTGIVVDCTN